MLFNIQHRGAPHIVHADYPCVSIISARYDDHSDRLMAVLRWRENEKNRAGQDCPPFQEGTSLTLNYPPAFTPVLVSLSPEPFFSNGGSVQCKASILPGQSSSSFAHVRCEKGGAVAEIGFDSYIELSVIVQF